MAFEESLCQSFLYLGLALQVGLRLVVYFVERDTHFLIGLVESGIYPVVHLFPQSTDLRVIFLPFHQHFVCFLDEWSLLFCLLFVHALGYELLDFFAVVLVESYVVVANEVIALLAAAFRSLAIAPFQPCQHRLTNVDAAVVHNVCLHHMVAVGLHNLCQ